jgi:osmoprotectant transport system substrate-binding protein
MSRSLKSLMAAAVLAALSTVGAQAAEVVVSSKIDTEGSLLGSMIAQALTAGGIPVKNRLQLGTTPVVRKALLSGEIDIYPEYTGNGAFFFNKPDDPAWHDPAKGYDLVKSLDFDANKLDWLTPASANNTWAIGLRNDVAAPNNVKSMSDFGKWITSGGSVKLVGSAEFVNSAAALPAFEKAYGFTLKPDQLLVLSGGGTAATIQAAAQKTDGVSAAMVFGTDGGIEAADLVVLDDDKNVQPVYEPTPVIRDAVLKANPKIADLLKPIFASLDLKTLQELNARVQVNGEPAADVAKDYLKTKGFVK